jgi:hypothetical protein
MNGIRTSVLNQENNTSGSVKWISDLGTEIRRSVLNGTFRSRLGLEITVHRMQIDLYAKQNGATRDYGAFESFLLSRATPRFIKYVLTKLNIVNL